jgi:PAN domain
MPKSKQVAGWLAVVGVALVVQGCGEDEQDRLTLLGRGGCRTADGSEGQYETLFGVSLDACKAQCFGENGPCTAVEYNSNNSSCEIHSEPITTFKEVENVECYVPR